MRRLETSLVLDSVHEPLGAQPVVHGHDGRQLMAIIIDFLRGGQPSPPPHPSKYEVRSTERIFPMFKMT